VEILDSDLLNISEDGTGLLVALGLERVLSGRLQVSRSDVRRAAGLADSVAKRLSAYLNATTFAKPDFTSPDFSSLRDLAVGWEAKLPGALASIADVDLQANLGAAVSISMQAVAERMPKVPNRPDARPSDFASAAFLRAWRTLNSPLTVVDDLEAGCLCRDQVETLQSAMPSVYELFATGAMAAVIEKVAQEPSFVVPYPRLKQLTVLLRKQLVPPDLKALLEQTFSAPEPSQAGGGAGLALGEMTSTNLQKRELGN